MKKTYLLAFTLLLSEHVLSQIPKDAIALEDALFDATFAKKPIPKASGKLLNLTAAEIKAITINYSLVTPFYEMQITKTAKPEADGTFQLKLDYPFPYQQIWFSIGELFYTGLTVNKDLYVELDMRKIKAANKEVYFNGEGVRYLGTDGALNVYLNNYILYKRNEQLEIGGRLNELIHPRKPIAGDIIPAYNQLYEEIKKIEDKYIAENPSPYDWILENERQSDYYADLLSINFNKTIDETLWQKITRHKSYLVSNNGSGFYRNMIFYIKSKQTNNIGVSWKDVAPLPDLDQSELASIDSLKKYEQNRVYISIDDQQRNSDKILKWNKQLSSKMMRLLMIKRIDKAIYSLDSLFIPAKADFLKLQISDSKDLNEQKIAMDQILMNIRTSWCKTVINSEHNKALAKIKEINGTFAKSASTGSVINIGKPIMTTSFGANMYEVNNMGVKEFLTKLKERFRDTAIVLDLWATWCAPCISEMPHSKKLLQETKNLPVVFVYLCTISGSDKEKWKSKVAELKQPGLHFFIDDKLDAEIRNLFSFSGYPGYAFIDRNGNYKPGAITRISETNKERLTTLVKEK